MHRLVRNAAISAAVIMGIALLPALAAGLIHPKRPAWTRPVEIDLATAKSWGKQTLWVDARSRADFDRGHIPGAVLLNEQEWERLLDPFLDVWKRDSKVVVYCSSANCDASREVARRLKDDARIADVHVLKGGWETWMASQK